MTKPPQQKAKNKYWFVLGREPLLSSAEIEAVFGLKNFTLNPPVLKMSLPELPDPKDAIGNLGGTIKIGLEIGVNFGMEDILNKMAEEIKKIAKENGKTNFGLSCYNLNSKLPIKIWGMEIKTRLRGEVSTRFVFKNEPNLSSVTVEKNGLTGKKGIEFLIASVGDGKYDLGKTLAVQPFEELGQRDFGRPARDDASGMLPPKLAMIMINLAQIPRNAIILDPFCGSGTILTEADVIGYKNLIGADISNKAIADTKKNFEWLNKEYKPFAYKKQTANNEIKLYETEIARIHEFVKPASIDAIITEPYLGKPLRGRETKIELEKQANELKKLYIDAFTEFKKIIKPKGTVVIIIPKFKYGNGWVKINCLEEIKKTGFEIIPFLKNQTFLFYHRPNQFVGREIYRFIAIS
ncbi:MAG: DNA methyltransferase [Patescibacteria group bacterium]